MVQGGTAPCNILSDNSMPEPRLPCCSIPAMPGTNSRAISPDLESPGLHRSLLINGLGHVLLGTRAFKTYTQNPYSFQASHFFLNFSRKKQELWETIVYNSTDVEAFIKREQI